jgi:dihydroneopterin aldolase
MLTISLEGMKFYSSTGIYPEEKILGNELLADIHISMEESEMITALAQTIDYEKVYNIIKQEMKQSYPMLETLVQSCIEQIKKSFPQALTIEMMLSKLHPPLHGEIKCSKVTLKKMF